MDKQKKLMSEAAILYYEKKYTQQEIARLLNLSRQTVSKLLGDAMDEHIVEIIIHNPENERAELEDRLCETFGIRNAVVCNVSGQGEAIRQLMTVKKAAEYISPILAKNNLKIAISWGRTIQTLIAELPQLHTDSNVVFPLFGATDNEQACFMSNELARAFADRIGAEVKFTWFPYRPDYEEDCKLLKRTSYYKKIDELWNQIDIAIVGIGSAKVRKLFEDTIGHSTKDSSAVGDIATHFFNEDGEMVQLYDNTLCASVENLKKAKQIIAIACGDNKLSAIIGALRTGMIDTLVIDECTAQKLLNKVKNV